MHQVLPDDVAQWQRLKARATSKWEGKGERHFGRRCKIKLRAICSHRGEMAERSMAVVLKTTVPERVPGVRIPLSPPPFAPDSREGGLSGSDQSYGWQANSP